jgi:hypothetical protein
MKGLKEIKADYQVFLSQMPEYLEWASANITKTPITYSLDEIEIVHLYYEDNFTNAEDKEYLKQVFIAYMGEAFIEYFGGNWELSTLKKDEAYGTPIILNWGNNKEPHVSISPFVWTEIIRKRGKMDRTIRQIFEGNINRFKAV